MASAEREQRLRDACLYLVADAAALERVLEGALAGGVNVVQLRDKTATDEELLRAARAIGARCREAGALFVVNDRPDLAVATGADGVHLGQDDEPVAAARAVVGPDAIVGLSTHSVEQAQAGARSGADYIAVGPVHETPTKEGRAAIGLEPVRWAAANVELPWFAIGGLHARNVHEVVAAGARRVVVVRAVAHAENPRAAVNELRLHIERSSVGQA